ncbi:MAG: hypothetical protein Fur0020_03420 [Thermodesulfovibrionia bacterium]
MFCAKVKEFLSQKGVKFTERDVMKDKDALNELKSMGIMTTPVTVIDGEKVIGYDTERLEQLIS